jgi:predicted dehydrogenase
LDLQDRSPFVRPPWRPLRLGGSTKLLTPVVPITQEAAMRRAMTRRDLLARSAVLSGAAAGAGAHLLPGPLVLAQGSPNGQLRVACIGVGGRGGAHVDEAFKSERIVALVDVDDNTLNATMKKVSAKNPDVKAFNDFRRMFDAMGKDVDAVFVATPDHTHAAAAMRAIRLGKHVYVEKPMCHNAAEVRALVEAAREKKVVTQLGCQGHSGEGYRRLVETIQSGVIGAVVETHTWCWCTWNFGYGGDENRPASKPAPKHLHWDEWIGPAPHRDFHDGLHPVAWRGWRDFGTGNLGDFGCHMLDGVFWSLGLGHASSVEALAQVGGSADRFPRYNTLRWEYPAAGDRKAVRVNWYDGGEKNADPELKHPNGKMKEWKSLRPAIVEELEKKHKMDLGYMATLYVGEKGILWTGVSGDAMRSVPESKLKEVPEAPKTLRRIAGTHQGEFLRACKGGEPANCNFDYAGPMNEALGLGQAAIRAGAGKKLAWDGPGFKFTNAPEANAFLNREYRKGWEIYCTM